ncbi:MAG: TrmB family transcriptional regulator [Thermoplasmata archaeon]|uniref:TrmB family transcriptional regulator n=1 Tax=Candidatus Sysuiplasma superficiale TaxID=2823368 RepID=A0A8J7YNK0_9ARCH|nr:TrmB family transcriptional regulator [Candidatus Sysuiplasma superficiale]MBX8643665.1 TrmB family transcriptional regulator [Candidatus Sysuiplasma superficiale]
MNLIKLLGENLDELRKEYESVIAVLRNCGLSEYEARSYMALVVLNFGTPQRVAEVAQIPRTSAYKALTLLESKGYATSTQGKPRVFQPEDPLSKGDEVAEQIREAFRKLSLVSGMLSEKGVPQLIYTIVGQEKVMEKIAELIDSSTTRFIISTPAIREIRKRIGKKFSDAKKRGVLITVITAPSVKLPDHTDSYRVTELLATDIVSDGKKALIAAPDLNACGFTDNESLAEHLESFLRMLTTKLAIRPPASDAEQSA